MKFKQFLLTERIYESLPSDWHQDTEFNVFINPTIDEANKVNKPIGGVIEQDGTLYIWQRLHMGHAGVADILKLNAKYRLMIDINVNRIPNVTVQPIHTSFNNALNDIKNNQNLIKALGTNSFNIMSY